MMKNLKLIGVLLLVLALGTWAFLNSKGKTSSGPQEALRVGQVATSADAESGDLQRAGAIQETAQRSSAAPVAPVEATKETSASSKAKATGPFLRGEVVDERRMPIAGAEVTITGKLTGSSLIELGQLGLSETAVTDSRGQFQVPRGFWPKAEITVEIQARGHLMAESTATPAGVSGNSPLGTFELQRGIILSGTVLGDDGEPVSEANVWRTEPDAGAGMPPIFAMANKVGRYGPEASKTDAEGQFSLAYEPAGKYVIQVLHEDHPRGRFAGETPLAGMQETGLTLRLGPSVQISGRVTGYPRGHKGVTVEATPIDQDVNLEKPVFAGLFGSDGDHKVEPEQDGSFTIKGLQRGERYTLQAFVKASIMNKSACTDAVVALADSEDVELTWDGGATVHFRLQDAVTGKPLSGGTVRHRWTDNDSEVMGNARKRLDFTRSEVVIRELRPSPSPGTLEFAVSIDGYQEERMQNITITQFEDHDLGTLSLRPSPTFRVQVLEASSGKPVRRARVVLRPILDEEGVFSGLGSSHSTGKTDRDGWCELEVCSTPSGSLSIRRRGFAPFTLEDLAMPKQNGQSQVVHLLEGSEIEISVVESGHEPAVGITVIHSDPNGVEESRETQQDGVLLYKDQISGEHRFRTNRKSAGRGRGRGSRFSTGGSAGDEEPEWQTLSLTTGGKSSMTIELEPTTSLSGEITLRGAPIAHAKVSLIEGDSVSDQDEQMAEFRDNMSRMTGRAASSTTTDSDGRFSMDRLTMGSYQLRVSRSGDSPAHYTPVKLGPGHKHVDVQLPESAVQGRVIDDRGRPVPGAGVRLRRVSDDPEQQNDVRTERIAMTSSMFGGNGGFKNDTDLDGQFQIEGIPTDVKLQIEVQANGFVNNSSETFEALGNQLVHAKKITLTRAGSIHVTVGEGTQRMFAPVYARRLDAEEGTQKSSIALVSNGEARLKGLTPGRWIVSEEAGGEGQELLVVAGQESAVEL